MDQNNPITSNPEMPQPLNTAAQTPTQMPMGVPTPPLGGIPSAGLPPQLPTTPDISKTSGGSKKMMMVIIIILVLAVLGVGGYFAYSMMGSKTDSSEEAQEEVTTPTPDLSGLETELEDIEITDPERDLAEIDKDISLLEATPSAR